MVGAWDGRRDLSSSACFRVSRNSDLFIGDALVSEVFKTSSHQGAAVLRREVVWSWTWCGILGFNEAPPYFGDTIPALPLGGRTSTAPATAAGIRSATLSSNYPPPGLGAPASRRLEAA